MFDTYPKALVKKLVMFINFIKLFKTILSIF